MCFAIAFTRETQQAFLEAHVAAFGFFGGVFATVRYDNLGEAVKKVLKGRRRVETDRFVALRSHYMFEAEYTRPGKEGAHEKGGVEGEVGRVRRNHLVPICEVADLGELNGRLADACRSDLARTIGGRRETVGEAFARESALLRALAVEAFDAAEVLAPRVDAKALVTIKQNQYSVPVGLAGLRVNARVGAREIEIRHDGRLVACHRRLDGRFEITARLDHISSCSSSRRARWAGPWRCARSATGAPGRTAMTSYGTPSSRRPARDTPLARWSTCSY